jgi:hypothetical protein
MPDLFLPDLRLLRNVHHLQGFLFFPPSFFFAPSPN